MHLDMSLSPRHLSTMVSIHLDTHVDPRLVVNLVLLVWWAQNVLDYYTQRKLWFIYVKEEKRCKKRVHHEKNMCVCIYICKIDTIK